ncbi:hypothetical protein ACFL96_11315, partial [Thermoproteota archaeon]
MKYPEAIAVKAADRLHNLLSFDCYELPAQRRILDETIEYSLPLAKSYDTVLFNALHEIVDELSKDPRLLLKYQGTVSAIIAEKIIDQYAHARACYSEKYEPLAEFIENKRDLAQKKLMDGMLIKALISTAEFLAFAPFMEAPNLPKLEDLGKRAEKKINRYVKDCSADRKESEKVYPIIA